MKARQIDKILLEKVLALAEAHPPIKHRLLKNSIVTGGCIASMLLKEKVNDYDIYFDSLPALAVLRDDHHQQHEHQGELIVPAGEMLAERLQFAGGEPGVQRHGWMVAPAGWSGGSHSLAAYGTPNIDGSPRPGVY